LPGGGRTHVPQGRSDPRPADGPAVAGFSPAGGSRGRVGRPFSFGQILHCARPKIVPSPTRIDRLRRLRVLVLPPVWGEHHERPGAYARPIETYSYALGATHHQRAACPNRQYEHCGLYLRRLRHGADARRGGTSPQSRHPLQGVRIVQCDRCIRRRPIRRRSTASKRMKAAGRPRNPWVQRAS